MCGVAGIFGPSARAPSFIDAMIESQRHRGPDDSGVYRDPSATAVLGHNRLSILDLSAAGRQPMSDPSGRWWLAFNGEIYNYRELREELAEHHRFRSQSDTEVLLAALIRWGTRCLDRLIGMFAFLLWDEKEKLLLAVRDRFGVKPLYYHHRPDGTLLAASEIRALHAAGAPREADPVTWASYLARGLHDHSQRTFWEGILRLPAGHLLTWQAGDLRIERWYDLAERVGSEPDTSPPGEVRERYRELLAESVGLRFRSDVPVGINLSGGLDSSTLLALVERSGGSARDAWAFTFVTGDPRYDELPYVERMLAPTRHPLEICRLSPDEVPELAAAVHEHQDEPFGGLPTLAYARLFEEAREAGVIVLLDGQGMDEQWAGYDYYARPLSPADAPAVQGTRQSPVRPVCLVPEFRAVAEPFESPAPFGERLRDLQYRDACFTKLPRALRFNDRVSMRASCELREPFLDHRLVELAFRQPAERKIHGGEGKWLLRELARELVPADLVEAPKRPVQTPQREWLRGPLRGWAEEMTELALEVRGGEWLDDDAVRREWRSFCAGEIDNAFFVWQWISLGFLHGP
ncbi:MAG: asparagine synthase (glutamine-hydrolyzing) [bacterium]|nr:asparagine synthase (glutamine-hydrolyzing) [bacterium]